VAGPHLTAVPLENGDVAALLSRIPTAAGVAQVLGPDGKSLLIGRPANLRRWAATQLGGGPPPRKKGARPPTNLTSITRAVAYAATTSPFAQRLAFERVMGRYVPLSRRRDLRPPVYLHLDPAARFPRLTARPSAADREHLYGPFRNRQAALAAIDALHELFPLRPCDFVFEPSPELAVGLGCVFAQVRTCAAPCLARMSEDDYRALAARAAAALGAPGARPAELSARLPPWVGAVAGARGLIADRGREGIELYPVVEGAVLEEHMVTTTAEGLESAVADLAWAPPADPRDDTPWVLPWLHGKRTGTYVVVPPGEPAAQTAARLR
jgi:hypothetical protein